MTTIRTWLDVLLIRCLSHSAKDGIEDFLETDFQPRVDYYEGECEPGDEDAEEGLRSIKHLYRVFCKAVRYVPN